MPQTLAQDAVKFLVAARKCELESLRYLLAAGRLVANVRALVHCLQRERGASSLYLGSGGRSYRDPLAQYVTEAGAAERTLRAELAAWLDRPPCPRGCGRLFGRIAMVLHGLAGLPGLRDEIRAGAATAEHARSSFTALIADLLAVVFEAADSAADPAISRALVALFNFMQGKELAGQERAIGATGFSQGGFGEALRQALVHRIEAQERCFQIFAEFCDADSLAHWQGNLTAPHTAELERLRRIACTREVPASAGTELAEIWFAQTTARIDALKDVEDSLEGYLQGLCEARIAATTAELASAEDVVTDLPQADTIAVIFGSPLGNGATDAALPSLDAITAPLGRSVMDLVQRQAQRLHDMEDELAAARRALHERKVVERAKALLMKHRNLTEEEAHRLLRKTAMNQGRRLVEVAEATVAMSDVLGA